MSEYLPLTGFLLVRIVSKGVWHHEIDSLVHLYEVSVVFIICVALNLVRFLIVLQPELRGVLLVFPFLFLAQLAIGFTHTFFHVL